MKSRLASVNVGLMTCVVVSAMAAGGCGSSATNGPVEAGVEAAVGGTDGAVGGDSGGIGSGCDSVAADFSAAGLNPHGAWSYGWTNNLGSVFAAYTKFNPATEVPTVETTLPFPTFKALAFWTSPTSPDGPPWIGINPTAVVIHGSGTAQFAGGTWTLQPGQLFMHPGGGGQYSVARWTAPVAGSFLVRGDQDVQAGSRTQGRSSQNARWAQHPRALGMESPTELEDMQRRKDGSFRRETRRYSVEAVLRTIVRRAFLVLSRVAVYGRKHCPRSEMTFFRRGKD
jgi:hypothetical protein